MVAVLLAFYVISMMDRLVITMMVDPIQRDLALSDFQMGLILGPTYALANALAVFPLGWAADRVRRPRLLFGSVATWSLATAGSAVARSLSGLVVGRLGVAVGEAALLPAAYSMIADKFPTRRLMTALAVFGMGPKIGTAAAFMTVGAVFAAVDKMSPLSLPWVGPMHAWRMVMLIIGAPGVLFAFLALTISEPARIAKTIGPQPVGGLLSFLSSNRAVIIPLLTGFSLMGICSGALNNWTPSYVTRAFGWGPARYGPAMGIISLIGAWAVIPKGLAVDWLFARGMRDAHIRFYTWVQLAILPVAVAAFLVKTPMVFLILYGAVNIVALTYLIYASAVVQLLSPSHLRGRVVSIFLFCSSVLAQGVGPAATGALSDFVFKSKSGLGPALAIVSISSLLLSLLALRWALRAMRGLRFPTLDAPVPSGA